MLAMPAYNASFPRGTLVQIASRADLEEFARAWMFHNPLTNEQLDWAGRTDEVAFVGYYHGGDVLYELKHAPGQWHECCLRQPPK